MYRQCVGQTPTHKKEHMKTIRVSIAKTESVSKIEKKKQFPLKEICL